MKNVINITENNNKLEIDDCAAVIVCGNSNYLLKFNFGEQWQKCIKKVAIFVINGSKITVDFDGDECNVPVLPNSSFVQVFLMSGNGDLELATTAVNIKLESTIAAGDLSEYNQLSNYLTRILTAINKIEDGGVVIKNAERADFAENANNSESATFAQTALIAQNVSNSNILINGDFKINQRGKNLYDENNKYTVDRWNLNGGTLVVNSDGSVSHTATSDSQGIRQYIEFPSHLAGEKLTLSCCCSSTANKQIEILLENNGNVVSLGIESSELLSEEILTLSVTLPTNINDNNKLYVFLCTPQASQSITYKWAKLEIGESNTKFIPRLYSDELNLCQRYYISYNKADNLLAGTTVLNTLLRFDMSLPVSLRTVPTIINAFIKTLRTVSGMIESVVITKTAINAFANHHFNLDVYVDALNVTVSTPLLAYVRCELDAEIY